MNCFRHPERTARRKCYFCKKPICPQCQIRLDHHIFCSEECHQNWLKKQEEKKRKRPKKPSSSQQKIEELEKRFTQTISHFTQLERRLYLLEKDANRWRRKANFFLSLILAFFFTLLVAGGGITLRYYKNNHHQKEPYFDPGYPSELEEPVYLEPPELELSPGKIPVEKGTIHLYGRAPGAKRVTLLINGREIKKLDLSAPEFVFRSVRLSRGANIIQLMAEDGNGQVIFSPAQMVKWKGRALAEVAYTAGLNYSRGSRLEPKIAITFDAGGEASYAKKVLDILREKGLRVTIFVTGRFIEAYPDIVRQMVEDGHEVANHTYSHPHLTTWEENRHHWTRPEVTREFLQRELLLTAQLFEQTTAKEMAPFWRAPYGEHNRQIRRWAEQVGFYHIDWTRERGKSYDTLDWLSDESSPYYRSPQKIREMLVNIDDGIFGKANGSIILMHLSTARGKNFPEEVLAPAIDALIAKGYEIVPVSSLFPGLVGEK